jgi:hypothetical protein
MNAPSPGSHEAATGQQTLANWLALFALLALGIVWSPLEAPGHGVRHTAVPCAGKAVTMNDSCARTR